MVTKVIGKVDEREVIFERSDGDSWKITVPQDLDGMYVIEVTAEDEAGNIAYGTKMLLIVDPETLCVSLQPYDYSFDIMLDEYRVGVIPDRYSIEAMEDNYLVGVQQDPYYLEVIYPMHRKGCCCE